MEQRKKRGVARKVAAGAVIALSATSLAGCQVDPPEGLAKLLHMGVPMDGVTPEAESIFNFWIWVWVAAWIIGLIMWGLMLAGVISWNRKAQDKKGVGELPNQLQYNIPLELVLTVIPVAIVMVLFFFTVDTQQRVVALDKYEDDDSVTVDVTGFQWNWKFGYAHVGANLAPGGQEYGTHVDPRDEERGRGTDEEAQALADASAIDPEGSHNPNPIHGKSMGDQSYLNYNEIETVGSTEEVPVLVVPADRTVEFRLASADVSHGFWVPEFLFKRDAYAHPEQNQQQRAFQIEKIKEGSYVGRCTEMCGTYHAMMNFEVRAVKPEVFTEYMQYRIGNPDAPNSEAMAAVGLEPYATTTRPFNSSRTDTRDGGNVLEKPVLNAAA